MDLMNLQMVRLRPFIPKGPLTRWVCEKKIISWFNSQIGNFVRGKHQAVSLLGMNWTKLLLPKCGYMIFFKGDVTTAGCHMLRKERVPEREKGGASC